MISSRSLLLARRQPYCQLQLLALPSAVSIRSSSSSIPKENTRVTADVRAAQISELMRPLSSSPKVRRPTVHASRYADATKTFKSTHSTVPSFFRSFSTQMTQEDDNDNDLLSSMEAIPQQHRHQGEHEPIRTSLLMELTDRLGVLHDVLRFFWKYDINITRIESRPCTIMEKFDFFVDLEGQTGDDSVDQLLRDLKNFDGLDKLLILDKKEVQWFPRHVSDLDRIANRTLDAGIDLESDHPGFNDPIYRMRREELAKLSKQHRWDKPIARIEYSEEEIATWSAVWDRMEPLLDKYACREYLEAMELMKEHCNYSRDAIPQQNEISSFLKFQTNFSMRPVSGLLSSRDFLNGLAFRTFFCTQYIRHHSKPLYTPEPDICHELLGHAPMFANRDFCDFSQEIGLASLGASDEDIKKLASCYWFSVEFGLCKEDGDVKAYGAGLLSSFGEIEYACRSYDINNDNDNDNSTSTTEKEKPKIIDWDPYVASRTEFPITTYQPVYFLADSLHSGKKAMRKFCEELPRPFFAKFNSQTETVYIDRPVKRVKGTPNDTQ